MKRVHIDRLQIRLTGVSPQKARSTVEGLGQQVLAQLARAGNLPQSQGRQQIEGIDAGTIRATRGTTPADMRTLIARQIAQAILSKSS